MSESARRRLIQISSGTTKSEVPVLIQRVVKIQSLFRGFMVRKRLEIIRSMLQHGTENGEFDDQIQEEDFFRNQVVKEVFDREGPYVLP